jgi:hypothetical protein
MAMASLCVPIITLVQDNIQQPGAEIITESREIGPTQGPPPLDCGPCLEISGFPAFWPVGLLFLVILGICAKKSLVPALASYLKHEPRGSNQREDLPERD